MTVYVEVDFIADRVRWFESRKRLEGILVLALVPGQPASGGHCRSSFVVLGPVSCRWSGEGPPCMFARDSKVLVGWGCLINLGDLLDNQGVRLSFTLLVAFIGFLLFLFSNFLLNLMCPPPPSLLFLNQQLFKIAFVCHPFNSYL